MKNTLGKNIKIKINNLFIIYIFFITDFSLCFCINDLKIILYLILKLKSFIKIHCILIISKLIDIFVGEFSLFTNYDYCNCSVLKCLSRQCALSFRSRVSS